ncbi:hypothetical protein FRC06_011540 [Ceratobasidium sp. 370]|nr:hypothetical protein FRC06_011540 [Ceratobasidium sp. 370]
MRIYIPSSSRYARSSFQEVDGRENSVLIRELTSELVPRSPRGGGGRGGGGVEVEVGKVGQVGEVEGAVVVVVDQAVVEADLEECLSEPLLDDRHSPAAAGGSRGSSTYSAGGGSRSVVTSGAFAGRSVGGGTRDQVYGNSRYGSGYTYGGGSYVTGRGFPFGYWPIYVPIAGGGAYYGYHEYGPSSNSSRPGGQMQQALVRSSSWPAANARRWTIEERQGKNGTNSTTPLPVPTINNATASYYIMGDADTVAAVMQEIVKACSVVNASGTPVGDFNSTVHVEQAVQYYRASSFMLALTSYNNTASLPSNAPPDNNTAPLATSADTGLPMGTDMNFLNCLNTTIGASIPIMDSGAPRTLHAFGGLNAVGIVWLLIWLLKMF